MTEPRVYRSLEIRADDEGGEFVGVALGQIANYVATACIEAINQVIPAADPYEVRDTARAMCKGLLEAVEILDTVRDGCELLWPPKEPDPEEPF